MKRISDRQIERARLGELDEQEYRELVEALEARGEMHRLEDAITRDEEFLQKYPPRMMASRIRTKLVEDEVKAPSDNPFALRTRAPVFALGAVLIAAIVAIWVFVPTGGPAVVTAPDSEDSAGDARKVARDGRPATDIAQGGPSVEFEKPETKWRGENVHQDMVCLKGERYSFAADPIDRLSVSPLGPIKAYTEDEGKTLVIECHQTGSAMIEIPRETRRNGRVVNFAEKIHVDVARELDQTEETSIDERISQLDECKTEQEPPEWFRRAKLTIQWDAAGEVRDVETSGSSAPGPVLDCLKKIVEGWKLPTVAHDVVLRQHIIFWENVRGPDELDFLGDSDTGLVGRPGREPAIIRAQSALLSGDNRAAIRHCKDVPNGKCYRILGVAYKKIGELEKSCEYFDRADLKPAHCGGKSESQESPSSKSKDGEPKEIRIW